MATPKDGSHAYKRVWTGCPSSERIIQDTDKFLVAIKVISKNEGVAVQGLGTRSGRRNGDTMNLNKRGGKRDKKVSTATHWKHEDATIQCIEQKLAVSQLRFRAINDSEVKIVNTYDSEDEIVDT